MGCGMSGARGEIRIIGGVWRSRRVRFPAAPGLRPTPDRVRETLFNWLGPAVEGASVLDLFAGSGALGLEALSRGAAQVAFVERSRGAAEALRANLALLGADVRARVHREDALKWLQRTRETFGLVFVDPPYASRLLDPALAALVQGERLTLHHRVYVEHGGEFMPPAEWQVLKETRAGDVRATLLRARESAPGRGGNGVTGRPPGKEAGAVREDGKIEQS